MSAHPAGTDPLAGHALSRLLAGLRAAPAGFRFALKHPAVLRWTLAAEVVYLAVWVAVIWAAAAYDARFVQWALWEPGPAWWQTALHSVAEVLLYVVFWLITLLGAYAVAMPITSPLFSFVAEATEAAFFGTDAPPGPPVAELVMELLRSVRRSVALLLVNVLGAAGIWLVSSVLGLVFPPAGTVVGVAFGGGWSALWIGMSGVNWVLENNRAPFAQQSRLARESVPLLLGFGLLAQWIAFIPLTAPFVVISGSMLVCRLHAHGRCPLPLREKLHGPGPTPVAPPA